MSVSVNHQQSTINSTRVRFAPSPTGYLHVGGARTALYNYLFARQNKGQFILRIEDTDRTRSTKEAINQITGSLKWLGLNWDEGLFRQTERLELYQGAAETLLQEKKAYLCFCPPEKFKHRQEKQKPKSFTCPLSCRNLPPQEVIKLQKKGIKPAIRLAAPLTGTTFVEDLIKGSVAFENENIDDYILMRSDGTPTYNMAVVVDDHTMKISHIIRGDDHLSNTPRQIVLYRALGYNIPKFAHLPLIAGEDKKPLSKRHGAVAIEEFRRQGYLPQALINYLALLGWGYDEKTTFFSLQELMNKFSLEKVSKNPAIWDAGKLLWMNGEYIRKLSDSELASRLQAVLKENKITEKDTEKLQKFAFIIKERIKTLKEAFPLLQFFYKRIEPDEPASKLLKKTENSKELLRKSRESLEQLANFNHIQIEHSLRQLAIKLGVKPSLLFQLIRVSISGRNVSPPLFESLEILGKQESLERIWIATSLHASQ